MQQSKEEHLLAEDTIEDDLEAISMRSYTNLEDLPSTKLRARLNSDVSIRHGHVYENRQKKQIPDAHKMAMLLFVVVCVFGIPWLIYGMSRGEQGIFMEGGAQMEEEEEQHERAITMDGRDWAGFSLAALLIMIAAGGGIGGGGVLVPTYIFVLGFDPKYAIPLSNCTILGSSISNLILNVNKRHPYANRPLIDWDIMLMMEPLTVAGALVGTFINVLSPPWLITIMLVILLVSAAYRTLGKGIKRFKQETAAMEQAAIAMDSNPSQPAKKDGYEALGNQQEENADVKIGKDNYSAQTVLAWSPADVKQWWSCSLPPGCQEYIHIVDECELDGADLLDLDYISLSQFDVKKMLIMKILRRIKQLKQSLGIQENMEVVNVKDNGNKVVTGDQSDAVHKARADGNTALVEILESESIHPPWKVGLMFATTGGMLTLTILKGGGKINPLNLGCSDALYWVLTIAALPWVLMISIIARRHLLQMYYAKKEAGFEYLETDVQWDERATIRNPLICSIAGLCAGMFGIGGGIVKGPLMLEMGVLPPVTSATSASMILFTSAGASVSYLVFEQLNLHYGIVVFCLGVVFTMIGQLALNRVVAYYKRNSLIILIIGITVALSAVAMGIESSGALIDLFNGHAESGGSLCGAGGE